MAGHPRLMHDDQQRVAIAIVADFLDTLDIARCLALTPELLTTAAPEPGEARLERLFERFLVHIGQHEDLTVLLLHDGRHEAFFIEFDHGNVNVFVIHQNLTSTPRDLRYSLTCRTVNVP